MDLSQKWQMSCCQTSEKASLVKDVGPQLAEFHHRRDECMIQKDVLDGENLQACAFAQQIVATLSVSLLRSRDSLKLEAIGKEA